MIMMPFFRNDSWNDIEKRQAHRIDQREKKKEWLDIHTDDENEIWEKKELYWW